MLLSQTNNLLGVFHNQILSFNGSDTEGLFKKNLSVKPDDWYYRSHPIEYKYNSDGHRCDEIASLDFDNYILFLGDSYTAGTGLELERSYPYLVSKNLGIPYYNLSVGGSGIDVMFYNLNMWLNQFPKPKYIFLSWSDHTRYVTEAEEPESYKSCGVWDKDSQMYRYGVESKYFDARLKLVYNMTEALLKFHKIPYVHTTFSNYYPKNLGLPFTVCLNLDNARDGHAGIQTHEYIAQYLTDKYIDKYMNDTPLYT